MVLSRLGAGLSLRSWLLLELDVSGVSVPCRRGEPMRASAFDGEKLDDVLDGGGDNGPYMEFALLLLLGLGSNISVVSSRERRRSSADPYMSGVVYDVTASSLSSSSSYPKKSQRSTEHADPDES
jgi:hypothetical protein